MTAMIAISFGVAVLLLLAACVKSDRVRGWRHSLNPSAPDLPDAAFVVGRVVFLIMAGVMVFEGFDLLRVSADSGWSDDELTSAVHQATDGLDGWMYRDDGLTTDSAYFDDYASLLEDKVIQYGGGGAPQSGVDAGPADTNTDTDAYFTVQADGTDAVFCTHIERTRRAKDDYTPPGIAGGEGTITERAYQLAVTSKEGPC
ncbi:hypothetical protein OHB53_16220 [Streptomyces sp. NBC_00056]|uniref:hypothetical protein n=1 Tax=unclassified Streptomyces TaxID=2593676 RepID=UPI00225AC77F|nr:MULTISPECIES: hypothetical protein [unclassified Streptomyces]MCX5440014.1 hypothetical protein [Streptomyces sp. NBC_00063]WSE17538.1 hypothetical protein OG518_31690 [Streptomyces sp. NBC_01397]WUB93571.1 hypothetical protein OHO83_15350 [Streptomyces sp. NBC_00569]